MIANHKIMENPALRQIVLLGYGTMISKYCNDRVVCPAELLKVSFSFFHAS